MKYLITERQHKLILEEKDDIFQELLNNSLTSIKKKYEIEDFDEISDNTCDEIDSVNKIELIGHHFWGEPASSIELHVDVYYENIRHITFEVMTWDIATQMRKWLNIPVRIYIEREINTKENFDW